MLYYLSGTCKISLRNKKKSFLDLVFHMYHSNHSKNTEIYTPLEKNERFLVVWKHFSSLLYLVAFLGNSARKGKFHKSQLPKLYD